MTNTFCAQPGTIIEATYRMEDLIPRFMDTLDTLKEQESLSPTPNVERWARIDDVLGGIESRRQVLGETSYYEAESAHWDLEDLMDLLNEYAPEGYFFGSHPGNGADFGFWEAEDYDA